MTLKQLAADGAYVFTYVCSPVPIAGATGAAGLPIAIGGAVQGLHFSAAASVWALPSSRPRERRLAAVYFGWART
jgi:hypothetical protein